METKAGMKRSGMTEGSAERPSLRCAPFRLLSFFRNRMIAVLLGVTEYASVLDSGDWGMGYWDCTNRSIHKWYNPPAE